MFANFILAEEEEMVGRGEGGSGMKKKGLSISKFKNSLSTSLAHRPELLGLNAP